jgi:formate hydrogenlyase subunit 6/NADH:ubiquinone oxidoreductase subunit I/coenzyme F420-reducing hydrogenase delta subunit
MKLGIILDAVLDETHHVSVTSELCKRVRFRRSTCRNCVDVCPDNAITLSPGPAISDNCSNCGLCQNACPAEVFQNDVDWDRLLLKKMESLLGKDQTPDAEKGVFIHCSQARKQHQNSLAIHCLGNMSENVLLGAALSGLAEINLAKGHCAQCHLKNGESLLTKAMTTTREMVESIGLNKLTLRLIEAQKDSVRDARLTRRELFSKIAHRETVDATSVPSAQGDGETANTPLELEDGTRPSPRRAVLCNLIKHNGRGNTSVSIIPQALPWKKMIVDEANCVACAICVNVCPTGALSKILENNQVVRHLDSRLCSNCSLCREACPERVISFEETYAATELSNEQSYVVARIDMTSCAVCGEIIPARGGEVCATCEKRQIAPMFMNV